MADERENYVNYGEELRRLLPRSLHLKTDQAEEDLNRLSHQMRKAIDSLDLNESTKLSSVDSSEEDEYPVHEGGYSFADTYLKKAKTFFELRSLIQGTEADSCATSKLFVVMHELLLAEFVDACTSLISRRKLKSSIVKYLLEEGLVWVLRELTKIALLKSPPGTDASGGDKSLIECKIIEESFRWLRDGTLNLDQDSLCLSLNDVFVPLLSKLRKFPHSCDVHITRVNYRSEFERFCRCSSDYSIYGIIESLKILTLNDERVLEWAFDEFDEIEDEFSDSLLDICMGSLIEDGQWERIYEILDQHAVPKANSMDDLQRRKAAWMFAISLENEHKRIHELLVKYKPTMLALLEDDCPAVRREARLFWLKVGLTKDNELEVIELVAIAVAKIIERIKADDFAPEEAEFEILRHAGTWFNNEMSYGYIRPISRLKFNCSDWLALPVLQDKLETGKRIDQFYSNLRKVIAHLPGKQVIADLERMVDMYEELLSRENLIWLDFNYVLLMTQLRLLFERTGLANESGWSNIFARNRCKASLRFLEGTRPCAFEPLRQISRIIKYLRRPINVVAILAAIEAACTFLSSSYKWLDTSPAAKLIELLACQVHQQQLHSEENDRLIWERFEHYLGDELNRPHQIQMIMLVNYMTDSERERAYENVMKLLDQLDLALEPMGIHNKRVLLQLLSKYIEDFKDDLNELNRLIPMGCKLCTRLIEAYELAKTGEYGPGDVDCQVTCWEMIYSTDTDDRSSYNYECEFDQFHNSLNKIDLEPMDRVIESLDAKQVVKLYHYRTANSFAEKPSFDDRKLKVQCSYQSYLSNSPRKCIIEIDP